MLSLLGTLLYFGHSLLYPCLYVELKIILSDITDIFDSSEKRPSTNWNKVSQIISRKKKQHLKTSVINIFQPYDITLKNVFWGKCSLNIPEKKSFSAILA